MATEDMEASLEGCRRRTEDERVILIAGPTASGKSALALELARKLDGVIINADSMQLYEDLRVVSARPSAEEETEVPHRLYGVLSASTAFSTGEWLRQATEEIEAARMAGKMPILVGGTGLYFKGLTEGFAEMPAIADDVRHKARDLADAGGVEGLRSALVDMGDGEAAFGLNDPQRLTRALEVLMATGKPLSVWQREAQSAPLLPEAMCQRYVLAPPRPWLHERIEQRAPMMLSQEGCEEIRALLAKNFSSKLPAMRAIGVAEIGAYLNGECDYQETVHRLTVATRQYAKRQETWFRNQMGDWQRIDPSNGISTQDFQLFH